MSSFTHAQLLAAVFDPRNQGFFNNMYGEPKEMKCYLCDKVSVSHGNNAQPFCKENRQELVCDECNKEVLFSRKVLAQNGYNPYCCERVRDNIAVFKTEVKEKRECGLDGGAWRRWKEAGEYERSESPAEASAPTRTRDQTKSQSKRAM